VSDTQYDYHCMNHGHVTVGSDEKPPVQCWCGSSRFWRVEHGWPAHFKEVWEKSHDEAIRLIANQSQGD